MHGTGTALGKATPKVRVGQAQLIAQYIEQRRVCRYIDRHRLAIEDEVDGRHASEATPRYVAKVECLHANL
jgi:hypothetical protein